MKTRYYTLCGKVNKRRRVALVADLHDENADLLLGALRGEKPDIIAVAGDLTNNFVCMAGKFRSVLNALAETAPVFYSLGNHEYSFNEKNVSVVEQSGVRLLLDEFVFWEELCIGGLRSRTKQSFFSQRRITIAPHCGWLDEFEKQDSYKILLNHHPEYYEPYLINRRIDLILSGHAHGGQMRIFGQGLFAPGQGILPRYSNGIYDKRMIVSAGLANTAHHIPRWGNPTELVVIDIEKQPQE